MNVLMVSYNSYGTMGTSGTYNLAKVYSKYSNFTLLCNLPLENLKVCEKSKDFNIVERTPTDFFKTICEIVKRKNIDVIIFAVSTLFLNLIPKVKNRFKKVKCILDLKSPRLSDKDKNFNKKTTKIQDLIDLIITPSFNNIDTWIKNYKGKYFIYDLGVNIKDFKNVNFKDKFQCKKFVYIGQLHIKRNIIQLLTYINKLPKEIKKECVFDLYGGGSLEKDVRRFIKDKPFINLKKLLYQKDLYQKLSDYDVGISWIPYNLYNNSPSLKFIEYISAGIYPITTNTIIHRQLKLDFNLTVFYDESHFIEIVENLYHNGIKKEKIIQNYNNIQKYDWDIIGKNILRKIYEGSVKCINQKCYLC